jgi:hypothetical protein
VQAAVRAVGRGAPDGAVAGQIVAGEQPRLAAPRRARVPDRRHHFLRERAPVEVLHALRAPPRASAAAPAPAHAVRAAARCARDLPLALSARCSSVAARSGLDKVSPIATRGPWRSASR